MFTQEEAAASIRNEERSMRRRAKAQGLALRKSRTRNTDSPEYDSYMLVDRHTNAVVSYGLPSGYGLSLEEVHEQLEVGE